MRERLPDRRESELFDFTSMNMLFTASVSRYEEGPVAELFLDKS
jgi:hypothetical protein